MKQVRFIPFRKTDIVSMCLSQGELKTEEHSGFEQVYQILQSILHFEFHSHLNSLKDSYASFDPDADTRLITGKNNDGSQLVILFEDVLNKANYEKIPQSELEQALNEESLFKIKLQVDFDAFSKVLLYCRGESKKNVTVNNFFGLYNKDVSFTNYERVVILLKQKHIETTDQAESIFLKLFKNVPKADLEMLFPNTKIKMRTIDKLLIGVPAAMSGGIIITTKLGATVILLASLISYWVGLSVIEVELDKTKLLVLLAGIGTLAGYLWKQLSSFNNKKLRFMNTLTENLYFKNLDNNAGVFHRIIDDAEEEECKEVILAYYFLLISDNGLSKAQLDSKIELWFQQQWQCDVNFEIEDAVNKLKEYQLIIIDNEIYRAVSIIDAQNILDSRWDNFFN